MGGARQDRHGRADQDRIEALPAPAGSARDPVAPAVGAVAMYSCRAHRLAQCDARRHARVEASALAPPSAPRGAPRRPPPRKNRPGLLSWAISASSVQRRFDDVRAARPTAALSARLEGGGHLGLPGRPASACCGSSQAQALQRPLSEPASGWSGQHRVHRDDSRPRCGSSRRPCPACGTVREGAVACEYAGLRALEAHHVRRARPGMRMEPPVSDPSPATASPSATDTAAPEDDPPGMRGWPSARHRPG
jgi:hypothetical protein